jgi:hypothetical protein
VRRKRSYSKVEKGKKESDSTVRKMVEDIQSFIRRKAVDILFVKCAFISQCVWLMCKEKVMDTAQSGRIINGLN